jgi:hypothetical protein
MDAFWDLAAIRDGSDQMGNEWFDVLVANGCTTLGESSLCSCLHRGTEVYHTLGQHRNNFGEKLRNLFWDVLRNTGKQRQGFLLHLPLGSLIDWEVVDHIANKVSGNARISRHVGR